MGKPNKGSETASKSDKKFEKKLQFYTKVKDTLTSLSVQKEIGKRYVRKKKRESSNEETEERDLEVMAGSEGDDTFKSG